MMQTAPRKKIVIAGTQEILQLCLRELIRKSEVEILAIYTSNENERSLKNFICKNRWKLILRTQDLKKDLAFLKSLNPDILVSAQYHKYVDQKAIRLFKNGCFNLHFSLLPKYAGCYPITWAIRNGEKETGVTIHRMTEYFDGGDIIAQAKTAISPSVTGESGYQLQTKNAISLFKKTLPQLLSGKISAKKQNKKLFLYYDKKSINWTKDCYVCWEKKIYEIHNHIRAFTFPKYQLPKTFLNHQEVTLSDSEIKPRHYFRDMKNGVKKRNISEGEVLGVLKGKAAVLKDGKLLLIGRINGQKAGTFINKLKKSSSMIQFCTT